VDRRAGLGGGPNRRAEGPSLSTALAPLTPDPSVASIYHAVVYKGMGIRLTAEASRINRFRSGIPAGRRNGVGGRAGEPIRPSKSSSGV